MANTSHVLSPTGSDHTVFKDSSHVPAFSPQQPAVGTILQPQMTHPGQMAGIQQPGQHLQTRPILVPITEVQKENPAQIPKPGNFAVPTVIPARSEEKSTPVKRIVVGKTAHGQDLVQDVYTSYTQPYIVDSTNNSNPNSQPNSSRQTLPSSANEASKSIQITHRQEPVPQQHGQKSNVASTQPLSYDSSTEVFATRTHPRNETPVLQLQRNGSQSSAHETKDTAVLDGVTYTLIANQQNPVPAQVYPAHAVTQPVPVPAQVLASSLPAAILQPTLTHPQATPQLHMPAQTLPPQIPNKIQHTPAINPANLVNSLSNTSIPTISPAAQISNSVIHPVQNINQIVTTRNFVQPATANWVQGNYVQPTVTPTLSIADTANNTLQRSNVSGSSLQQQVNDQLSSQRGNPPIN